MKENKARTDILSYLRRHSQAGDTLEGITRWWLLSERVSLSVTTIKEALEQLDTEGLILARDLGDGKLVYLAREADDQS